MVNMHASRQLLAKNVNSTDGLNHKKSKWVYLILMSVTIDHRTQIPSYCAVHMMLLKKTKKTNY